MANLQYSASDQVVQGVEIAEGFALVGKVDFDGAHVGAPCRNLAPSPGCWPLSTPLMRVPWPPARVRR
ncbi:MAG: hypothetical protein WBK19_02200 [Azonexus sp.]